LLKHRLKEEVTLRITDVEGKELYNKKFFSSTEIPAKQFCIRALILFSANSLITSAMECLWWSK
jgi:hypothetical protein